MTAAVSNICLRHAWVKSSGDSDNDFGTKRKNCCVNSIKNNRSEHLYYLPFGLLNFIINDLYSGIWLSKPSAFAAIFTLTSKKLLKFAVVCVCGKKVNELSVLANCHEPHRGHCKIQISYRFCNSNLLTPSCMTSKGSPCVRLWFQDNFTLTESLRISVAPEKKLYLLAHFYMSTHM